MERVYLDNAATSWPKPASVLAAVVEAIEELGAPAGRSTYDEAATVERRVADTRRSVAELFGVADPRRVIFTSNGTDSLNLALHGTLRAGDHVVTSVVEHNSVLRPLRFLERHGKVQVTRVECNSEGRIDPQDIEEAIRPNTRMIAMIHASNVTGLIQPAEAVGDIAQHRGLLFLLDAAQTAGYVPLDVERLGCSFLATPAHKGLLAPLGMGLLIIAPGAENDMQPVRQGGTGTTSELDSQPETLPDRFESGNHNVPGIFGLYAGIEFLRSRTIEAMMAEQQNFTKRLIDGLRAIPGVTLYGTEGGAQRVGLVSATVDGYDPQEIASLLDSAYRVQVRAGLHCAPRIHQTLGTFDHGGTVRISLGHLNTLTHIDRAVTAITEIAEAAS